MKKEFTGKNVQQAIEKGLKELGKAQEDVDIKIIEQGGFFKKAKVELIYEEETKEEQKEVIIEESKDNKKEDKKIKKEKSSKDTKNKCECNDNCNCGENCNCEENKEECNKNCECHNEKQKEEIVRAGTEFLLGLFKSMDIENEVSTVETERGICFVINGDNVNELIGYRGETLNSLQFLLGVVIKNKTNINAHVLLDIENYKARRESTLIALAERLANKAIKTHKPVRLEPMTAYERRIIHTALQGNDKIITKSEGNEPNRRLFIIPKNK